MCIASLRAAVPSEPLTRTSTPILFAGGCTYSASSSPSPASMRVPPTSSTFSPILAISSSRRSSRPSSASGPSASTASSTASANERNSSFFETGSVSQPTATIAPTSPETVARTSPSVVARPAFLPAAAMPCSRRSRWAASTSPPVSSSARLAAIIPAPVRSRSSLTRLAEIWTWLTRPPPACRDTGTGSGSAAGSGAASASASGSAGPLRLGLGLLGRRGREVGGLGALLALGDRLAERVHDQAARADRVVVARDHEVGLVRVAVRVHERDHRHPEPPRLAHRELLLAQVDDEDRVRLLAHVGDAAEVRLELLELVLHRDPLLGRQQLELALVAQAAQLVEVLDPLGDRAPVGEQAAEPAVVHVRHARALGLLLDGVLGLLLGADEEDGAAALGEVADEALRLLEALERLLQIDDVDAAALAEDETAHLRVPAARLVAEMDSGLQELSHGDCHRSFLPGWLRCSCAGGGRVEPASEAGTATCPDRRVGDEKSAGKCSGRSGLGAFGPIT